MRNLFIFTFLSFLFASITTTAFEDDQENNNKKIIYKLNANLEKINSNGVNYIHCAGGYRSMIASSILKARGIHNIIDIKGGYSAISDSSIINKTKYACQSQN